ncbi:hypothetical protein Tco_0252154 [Tanacetum coccineum]
MSRKGLKFSRKITPLFPNMLTHAAEGEGLREPTEPQPTPSPTQPSTGDQPSETSSSHATTQDSRDTLEGTNRNEGDQVQTPHDSPLLGGHTSDRAEGALNLQELSVLCTNLSNRALALESIKDAQAAEISALKSRIKKLEKKCKPSISHHRAWLKSVKRLSMKKRFGKKESAVDKGRQSGETEEVKLTDDTEVIEDKGSGDKGGNVENSSYNNKYNDDEDITMAQTLIKMKEEKAKEKGVSIKDVDDSSRPARSILTLKPLPTIDPKDKGKGVLKESPVKKVKRSDLDAAQIAKDAEIARLAIYIKEQERDADFVPIRFKRDEKIIDKMNKKAAGMDEEEVPEEPESTKVEVKQEGREENIRKRSGRRLKMKAIKKSKRQKTDSDLEEEEQLRASLKIVPDEEKEIDYKFLGTRGDLRIMFEETADDDIWKNQEKWIIKSWTFYENCRVHILALKDGTEIHMLVERRYPLIRETLEMMMKLRLTVESEGEDCWVLEDFTTYCYWFNIGAASEDLVLLRKIEENRLTLGWLLEEIHATLAQLEKKRTRLQLYIKSYEENSHTVAGDGVTVFRESVRILRRIQQLSKCSSKGSGIIPEVPNEPKENSSSSSSSLSRPDDEVEDVSSAEENKADENKADA